MTARARCELLTLALTLALPLALPPALALTLALPLAFGRQVLGGLGGTA